MTILPHVNSVGQTFHDISFEGGVKMGHSTTYDTEHDVVKLSVIDKWSVEDAEGFYRETVEMLEGKTNKQILVDLNEAKVFTSSEARKLTAKYVKDMNVTHLAIFNANPVVRIMGKILMQLTKETTKGNVLNTEQEALDWVMKERG
jgi:hypothetical protein